MVTTDELFIIVNNNDYKKLKRCIDNNGQNIFSNTRLGNSILYRAIEYRAKECFDLLIEINDLSLLKNESSYINGLHIAVKYYNNAPNESNLYYLESLIKKGVNISVDILKNINDKELFMKMFLKSKLGKNGLEILLKHFILIGKMELIENIYFWLHEEKPNFFETEENRIAFLEELFPVAIKNSNLEMIDIIRTEKIDLKIVKENNQIMNSLYYALKSGNKESFEYLINFFKELSQEEFDKIKDIKNLNFIFDKKLNFCYDIVTIINKFINLKYDYGDQTSIVENIIKKIFESRHSGKCIGCDLDDILSIILILHKKNLIKKNPFINLINNAPIYTKEYETCLYYFKSVYNSRLHNLKYVMEHLKITIPEQFAFINKQFNSEDFKIEKNLYIKSLNNKINSFKNKL